MRVQHVGKLKLEGGCPGMHMIMRQGWNAESRLEKGSDRPAEGVEDTLYLCLIIHHIIPLTPQPLCYSLYLFGF